MNKTTKIVIAVLVVGAIAYGVYRWYSAKNKKDAKVIPIAGDAAKAA